MFFTKKQNQHTETKRTLLYKTYFLDVYNFAFRMTADSSQASLICQKVFKELSSKEILDRESRLEKIWILNKAFLAMKACDSTDSRFDFDLLDSKLRSERTRTDIVRGIGVEKRDYYLWELKQGCMTAVINCLPFGERAAFILKNILKMGETESAEVLEIAISAFRVRISRSRLKITNYLSPRCEHVDPNNSCRCPSRIGVALANGFIGKKSTSIRSDSKFGRYGVGGIADDAPLREIEAIYSNLPNPEPLEYTPEMLNPAEL